MDDFKSPTKSMMIVVLIQTSISATSNSFQHLIQITTYFWNFNRLDCETAEYYILWNESQ